MQRQEETPNVTNDINVLALVKGKERYVFLYDDDNRSEALRTLGRYASNQELSFNWYDAAVLSQKIRQTASPAKRPAEQPAERSAPRNRFRMPHATDNLGNDDLG